MSDLKAFFGPISQEQPAGKVEAADKVEIFSSLLAQTEIDWKEVTKKADELLPQVRHIGLAAVVVLLQTREAGFVGLHDGIEMLTEWVTRHWDHLYPPLDTDLEKPEERARTRLNSLAGISSRGYGDPLKILPTLDEVVFINGIGNVITLGMIDQSEAAAKKGVAKEGVVDLAKLEADARSIASDPDLVRAVSESLELLGRASEFLRSKTGTTPSWELLTNALEKALHWLTLSKPSSGLPSLSVLPASALSAGGPVATKIGSGSPPPGFSGSVNDRGEARRALGAVCAYYSRSEPASPVPLVIRRLLRFMDADFRSLVGEFAPAGLDELEKVIGKEKPPAE